MAHRLVPHEGQSPHSTDEVVRRFVRAFPFVQVSRKLGEEYMDAVLEELRVTQAEADDPEACDLARAEEDRTDALHVVCCTSPRPGANYFATTVIRGVMLIDYPDRETEERAEELVVQAAELLGYRLDLA